MGKLILCIALAVCLASLPVHSTVITTENGVINCDGLICPKGSASCIVSNKTCDNLKSYIYIRQCVNALGIPTSTLELELTNPYPGKSFDSISTSHATTEKERKEIDESVHKIAEDAQKLNEDLEKQFSHGFPFNKN